MRNPDLSGMNDTTPLYRSFIEIAISDGLLMAKACSLFDCYI